MGNLEKHGHSSALRRRPSVSSTTYRDTKHSRLTKYFSSCCESSSYIRLLLTAFCKLYNSDEFTYMAQRHKEGTVAYLQETKKYICIISSREMVMITMIQMTQIIQFNSIQFNGCLLRCRLNSTTMNYKATTRIQIQHKKYINTQKRKTEQKQNK